MRSRFAMQLRLDPTLHPRAQLDLAAVWKPVRIASANELEDDSVSLLRLQDEKVSAWQVMSRLTR